MIIEVKELNFQGFHIELVEGSGWKIVLKDIEYLFPTLQAAQSACVMFHDFAQKNGGKKIISTT